MNENAFELKIGKNLYNSIILLYTDNAQLTITDELIPQVKSRESILAEIKEQGT